MKLFFNEPLLASGHPYDNPSRIYSEGTVVTSS